MSWAASQSTSWLREETGWAHYAIEVNLRKGGTTHPFLMLQFLTDGAYDSDTGLYHTPAGRPCFYRASDNLEDPAYRGLSPDDLIDVAVENGLHFDAATQQGVVFHMIGALSEHGKLGAMCIGDSREAAARLYRETAAVLDREARRFAPDAEADARVGEPALAPETFRVVGGAGVGTVVGARG